MIQPKPCPFCGDLSPGPLFDLAQGFKWGAIECPSCAARGPEVRTNYQEPTEWIEDAIIEWNKRVGTR